MGNVLLNPYEQDDYSEQDSGYSSHTPSETSELSYISEQCSEIMTTEEAAQYIEEENNRFFAEYRARFGQFLYQYVDSVSQLQKKSFNKRILQKRIKKIKKANRRKARLEAKANRKN